MRTTVRASAKALLVIAGTTGLVALGSGTANAAVLGEDLSLDNLSEQVPQLLGEVLSNPLGDTVSIDPEHPSNAPERQQHSGVENSAPEEVSEDMPLRIIEDTEAELDEGADTHQIRPDLVELHGDADEAGTVTMAGATTPQIGQDTDLRAGLDELLEFVGLPKLGEPSEDTETLPQSAMPDPDQDTVDPVGDVLPEALARH